jgi:hypothetical protein
VNKVVIIGIILTGMILGIWGVFSLDIFSVSEDNDKSEPTMEKEGENSGYEPKPTGRNFSIELDEKMGLSAP